MVQAWGAGEYGVCGRPYGGPSLEGGFPAIQQKVQPAGGSAYPVGFLHTISQSELQVLGAVHPLADPIDVSKLTAQGAYNLLPATKRRATSMGMGAA